MKRCENIGAAMADTVIIILRRERIVYENEGKWGK